METRGEEKIEGERYHCECPMGRGRDEVVDECHLVIALLAFVPVGPDL